jgi:flagellar biosynthesis protein FliP
MRKPILEALFNGKIRPWERSVEHTSERMESEQQITETRNYFKNNMPSEDFERFHTIEKLYSQSSEDVEIDAFLNGFRLGALIMLEILEDADSLISSS